MFIEANVKTETRKDLETVEKFCERHQMTNTLENFEHNRGRFTEKPLKDLYPFFKLISQSSGRIDYIETIGQWRK